MKLIGITGGVGAGKSALLAYLKENYNCRIVLADDVARQLYQPGSRIFDQLVALLDTYRADPGIAGENVEDPLLLPDGTINHKEMAARIFANKDLLGRVNALVHPAVQDVVMEEVSLERTRGVIDYFFLEAALLIEAGYRDVVDELWYIYAREDVRRKRLKESRGYTDEKIDSIMKSQLSEADFRRYCDVVIDNSGDLQDSFAQIDRALA